MGWKHKSCPLYLCCKLLKNTKLLRIIFILFCGGASSYGITFIFPALALEWGSSKFYSSLILSVAGACEVLSKLTVGVVVDTNFCNKYFLWTVLFLLAGTGAIVTSLTRSLEMLMIYAVVLGTTGLNFTCLVGPVISDCVPYHALGGAMGLYLLAYGTGISLGYPLIGEQPLFHKKRNKRYGCLDLWQSCVKLMFYSLRIHSYLNNSFWSSQWQITN